METLFVCSDNEEPACWEQQWHGFRNTEQVLQKSEEDPESVI